METERIVVPSRKATRRVRSLAPDEVILIRCECPTLTMGLPSEAVTDFAANPDGYGPWGERDTLKDAMLADAASRVGLMRYVEDGEDNGLEDCEVDPRLEDRPDSQEHEVVFAEATR